MLEMSSILERLIEFMRRSRGRSLQSVLEKSATLDLTWPGAVG